MDQRPDRPKRVRRDFTVTKVFGAYRHRAARKCLMVPWFGLAAKSQLRDVPTALDKVRDRWSARLLSLHEASWRALPTWGSVTFATNCPPSGVRTVSRTRRCGHASACPFCFSRRRVLEPFRRLERTLYGVSGPYMQGQQLWERERGLPVTVGQPQLPLLRPDLKIVWFRTRVVCAAVGPPVALNTLAMHVKHARDGLNKKRRSEADFFRSEHAEVQFDVYPLPRRGKMCVVRAGVLLVPADLPADPIEAYAGISVAASVAVGELPASKENLAVAFYRAVRYPRFSLTGDPAWAAATMNLMHRFRATSTFRPWKSKNAFGD